jgi:hypothetical protein
MPVFESFRVKVRFSLVFGWVGTILISLQCPPQKIFVERVSGVFHFFVHFAANFSLELRFD